MKKIITLAIISFLCISSFPVFASSNDRRPGDKIILPLGLEVKISKGRRLVYSRYISQTEFEVNVIIFRNENAVSYNIRVRCRADKATFIGREEYLVQKVSEKEIVLRPLGGRVN